MEKNTRIIHLIMLLILQHERDVPVITKESKFPHKMGELLDFFVFEWSAVCLCSFVLLKLIWDDFFQDWDEYFLVLVIFTSFELQLLGNKFHIIFERSARIPVVLHLLLHQRVSQNRGENQQLGECSISSEGRNHTLREFRRAMSSVIDIEE